MCSADGTVLAVKRVDSKILIKLEKYPNKD